MTRLATIVLLALPAIAAEPIIRPASNADPEGKVGERPYEMVWANRKPAYPELVDFEDLTGWTAAGYRGCTADLVRSREEQMFGTYTGKIVYKGDTPASSFELRPPKPLPIAGKPTAAQMWVRGNNWGFHPRPRTARTSIYLMVRDAKGEDFGIQLGYVNFDYWSLLHVTFVSPTGQLVRIGSAGNGDGKLDYPLSLVAISVRGCADEKPAKLSFDALQFYTVDYKPLAEPKLPPTDVPWPTTPDTITPTPTEKVTTRLRRDGAAYVFTATGKRDTIRWLYTPKKGSLDDLAVEINGRRFQANAGGGPVFELGGSECQPGDEGAETKLLAQRVDGDVVETRWRVSRGGESVEFLYRLRAKGKSLQITAKELTDPKAGGKTTAFRTGHTRGTPGAWPFSVPYMSYGHTSPNVVHYDGVFIYAMPDWYNSDASVLFAEVGKKADDEIMYNGGSQYRPKTDGRRNPLRERLIVTVATDFHEVLPHIPHPQNPTAHLAKAAIWRNVGVPQPDLLKKLKAGGVERFICPLHETGWRDTGESFTFRLRCAPRIGDAKMKEFGTWVKSLGYWFGLYANYTDYASVNGRFREDRVCLQPDGNWTGAWPRCYAPKPTYAWQAQAELAPKIAAKFGANTCYSDVHTAITPWGRTDYDHRTPGAGMFRTAWASYAHLLWNECKAYGGPVFSEGCAHWFYAGLISGNYAQITGPERWKQPPLVDFDLLKMHPLMTDFGMGYPPMFYPRRSGEWLRDRRRTSPWFDRFTTSTLAFGHIGFLAMSWGFDGALKSFYMTNAVQQFYALVPVEAIRYFDGERLLPTSDAIRTGAHKRGQVYVRYRSGLELWCNLSFDRDWKVACDGTTYLLPPTGHLAFKKGTLLQYSALVDGQRIDYVESPDYFYLDSRDGFAAAGPLAGRGAVALKPCDTKGEWWAIPATKCDDLTIRPVGLGLRPDTALAAEAFDLDDKPLGEAEVRVSNLGHTLFPVESAVRYRVRRVGTTAAPPADEGVRRVVAGLDYTVNAGVVNVGQGALRNATIAVEAIGPGSKATAIAQVVPRVRPGREGIAPVTIRVPASARRDQRLWYRIRVVGAMGDQAAEGISWFAALAAQAVDARLAPADPAPQKPSSAQQLRLTLHSNLPGKTPITLILNAPTLDLSPKMAAMELDEGASHTLALHYTLPGEPVVAPIDVEFRFPQGTATERRWLRVIKAQGVAADLAKLKPVTTGITYRGKAEQALGANSGAQFYASRRQVGGVEKQGFFCHPPYKGGVGNAFGEFEVTLPDEPCVFETHVGFTDGSTTHDGCVFSLQVRAGDTWETVGQVQHAKLKKWKPFRADLSKFAGRTVHLRLVTDVGPADNSSSDWAMWGAPCIVLKGARLLPEVFATKPVLPIGPPPIALGGLTAADLKTVVEAKVVLDGAGVDGGGYRSDVYLNDVLIGNTPSSAGDTKWTEKQGLPIPAEALATIGVRNVVVIRNKRLDYMKVRRVHIWFRLRDGRVGTSVVVNGPFSTPPTWPHSEGILVPHGQDLSPMACNIPVGQ